MYNNAAFKAKILIKTRIQCLVPIFMISNFKKVFTVKLYKTVFYYLTAAETYIIISILLAGWIRFFHAFSR